MRRRILIEAGLAAMIFFAANAVFGFDALIARSLPDMKVFAWAVALVPEDIRSQLSEIGNMRLAAPLDGDTDKSADPGRVFCLQPQPGTQSIELHLPERALAPPANDGAVPYSLGVDLGDAGHTMSGTVTAGSCQGSSNVKVRVKVSKHALEVLQHVALTDTVTLFVDPE